MPDTVFPTKQINYFSAIIFCWMRWIRKIKYIPIQTVLAVFFAKAFQALPQNEIKKSSERKHKYIHGFFVLCFIKSNRKETTKLHFFLKVLHAKSFLLLTFYEIGCVLIIIIRYSKRIQNKVGVWNDSKFTKEFLYLLFLLR